MRKFWVIFFTILVVCTLGVSMIFVFSTRETIKISANLMYVNVGDEFALNVTQTNKDNSTTISAVSSDSSIVSFDNGLCVAKTGGVARITFTTSNSRYRNLYCDVMVGDGSESNPYYISSAEQFAKIGQPDSPYSVYSNYKLVSDIDFSTIEEGTWVPVNEFAGKLDGNGYTISNIMIGAEGEDIDELVENAGLFGTITADGAVYNLKIDNFFAFGKYANVGTIAGVNYGVIERVEVKNSFIDVTADFIGGIAGKNITTDSASLINERNVAIISKSSANVVIGQERKFAENGDITYVNKGVVGTIGGIAGQNNGGQISNTYSTGKVVLGESGIIYGGLVGDNQYLICSTTDASNSFISAGKIENGYSSISLFSNKVNNYSIESIGGVVGQNNDINEDIDANGVSINLNSNNLVGLYYDKNKLNISDTSSVKVFDGIGNNILTDDTAIVNNEVEKAGYVLGCTTNTMKAKTTYKTVSETTYIYNTNGVLISKRVKESTWDFENVWQISDSQNNGYPYLTYVFVDNKDDEGNNVNISSNNYIILDTYTLTISQGNAETEKIYDGICQIKVTDNTGKVVKETDASSISINVVEGFKVTTNSKGVVIYDLDNNVHYTVTFVTVDSSYKFSSIAIDSYTQSNNGAIKENANVNVWFRNINHKLSIIDSKTGKSLLSKTVTETTILSEHINKIASQYSKYNYVRFNTEINGTGLSYSASSRMPNKDLTLYVLYSNPADSSDADDEITEDNNDYEDDEDNSSDDHQNSYNIANEDDWNKYVVKYGDDSDVSFVQTKDFTITSSFKACKLLAGKYDAKGKTITVKGSLKDFALFDSIASGASVKGLTVEYSGATIKSVSNSKYFGGIANECKGIISNCNVDGRISVSNLVSLGVAGVCGHLYDGDIISCENEAVVVAEAQAVAGIVASMRQGNVEDCSNSADITNDAEDVNDYNFIQYGTIMASGIVGYMYGTKSKTVDNNINSGDIVSKVSGANNGANSAGIVAYVVSGNVTNNENNGAIESEYQAGGIVAYSKNGVITENKNSAAVLAITDVFGSNTAAGGIVGKITGGKVTNNTHSSGRVEAESYKNDTEAYAGGIIGAIFYGGTVKGNKVSSNCYISASGDYAFAGGSVGRVVEGDGDVSYTKSTMPSNWSSNYSKYVNATGANSESATDACYK